MSLDKVKYIVTSGKKDLLKNNKLTEVTPLMEVWCNG